MFKALFVLIAGTLVYSSLLTPFVYTGLKDLLPGMTWPFSRVFDRVAMLMALVFLVLVRQALNFRELSAYFTRNRLGLKCGRLLFGFVLSSLSVAVLLPFLLDSGQLVWAGPKWLYYAGKLLKVLPAALLISVIEESFFRALIYRGLKASMPIACAALVTSVLYALAHFIAPVKSYVYLRFDPWAGFYYLEQVLGRLLLPGIYPALFGLMLVGVLLCYVMQRTSSLFLCIGLHTGWVTALKMTKHCAVMAPGVEASAGLGPQYFLLAQPLTWLSMLLAAAVFVIGIECMHGWRQDEREKVRAG